MKLLIKVVLVLRGTVLKRQLVKVLLGLASVVAVLVPQRLAVLGIEVIRIRAVLTKIA